MWGDGIQGGHTISFFVYTEYPKGHNASVATKTNKEHLPSINMLSNYHSTLQHGDSHKLIQKSGMFLDKAVTEGPTTTKEKSLQ